MRSRPMPVSMDGFGQRRHLARRIAVELHEHEVPDFDEAPAAIQRKLLMLAALLRAFGPQIEVDLRARAARPCVAHLPEVVLLVETEDARLRNARDLLPQFFGLIVFAEDGDVELILRQPYSLVISSQA